MVRQNTDNRWIAKMNARLLHGSPKCTRARCTLVEMLATLVRFAVRFAIPLAGVDKAFKAQGRHFFFSSSLIFSSLF
jgi:hypothetical protein